MCLPTLETLTERDGEFLIAFDTYTSIGNDIGSWEASTYHEHSSGGITAEGHIAAGKSALRTTISERVFVHSSR